MESQTEKIIKQLTSAQKDFIRAALVCSWSTTSFLPLNTIETQVFKTTKANLNDLVKDLMNFEQPLIERGPNGLTFRFTKLGSSVAKGILLNAESYIVTQGTHIKITKPHKGRGENNKAMKKYAIEIGAEYIKKHPDRCNNCNHENTVFVRKGHLILCQVCFENGIRF